MSFTLEERLVAAVYGGRDTRNLIILDMSNKYLICF